MFNRRSFSAALAAVLATAAGIASAQTFPSRAITIVNPFPPGGLTDRVARVVGAKVSQNIGQQVLIDNKPGAAGIIAAEAVKRAPPDGYTVFMGHTGTHAINLSLYEKLPYDPVKDFVPITVMVKSSHLLVVHADSPAKTVADLAALAKSRPTGLSFASQGIASGGHLLGEMFKSAAGGRLQHIPYKGSAPAMQDLLANRVDLYFESLLSAGPHVRAGKIRALAITADKRNPVFPDVPTLTELGFPGVRSDTWFALYAPALTPQPVVRRLNDEFVKVLRQPETITQLTEQGVDVIASTPEELAALAAADAARLGKVVREAGIKAE
jgi:tripartite-type tricarboxylate transporter receptor subunit TctC